MSRQSDRHRQNRLRQSLRQPDSVSDLHASSAKPDGVHPRSALRVTSAPRPTVGLQMPGGGGIHRDGAALSAETRLVPACEARPLGGTPGLLADFFLRGYKPRARKSDEDSCYNIKRPWLQPQLVNCTGRARVSPKQLR